MEVRSLPGFNQMWRLRAMSDVAERWVVNELGFYEDDSCGAADLAKDFANELDDYPPELVRDGNFSTSWADSCFACNGGSSWLAMSFSLARGLQCVRLYQAESFNFLSSIVSLESWNGSAWITESTYAELQGGAWGRYNRRWANPTSGDRWRFVLVTASPLAIADLRFFSDLACSNTLTGIPIASATSRGAALDAIDTDVTSSWVAACDPCEPGQAWLGMHLDNNTEVLCASILLASAAARQLQTPFTTGGIPASGALLQLNLELLQWGQFICVRGHVYSCLGSTRLAQAVRVELSGAELPHVFLLCDQQELFNFLQLGVLVPTEDFEGTCQAYFGTWTFEEAYRRTGRPVTIVISSNFSRKLPACVMLNHMTVPRVTVASAVAASCAAIGVMRPRGLVVKDPLTGTLAPFNVLGESFADGSFTAEVPKDYLRSCFGATRFLVSQVNPHVSSFMDAKGGVLHSLRGHFGFDLQQRARMLSEYNLLPSFFGRAMCQATKHLSQDFQENKSGLTVHPPHVGLASVKAAISNPSLRDMERYILQGQRMAWEKAHEIRIMMLLEAAVTRCLERVGNEQASSTPYCSIQPPPEPTVSHAERLLSACFRDALSQFTAAFTPTLDLNLARDCREICCIPEMDLEVQIPELNRPSTWGKNAFDGDATAESAWVAGCTAVGCDADEWIGVLLEAPLAFQCVRIYQASGSLLGAPYAEVLRVDRWDGVTWEPSRTFGTVNPLSGGAWQELILLPAEAKFSMEAMEWRLLAESSVEKHWSVSEMAFFGNVECQFELAGTISASGEASNRFASAAVDGQVDTFWWSQTSPGPAEAWLGMTFDTPQIVRCVQVVFDEDPAYRASSVQLQSRPEVEPALALLKNSPKAVLADARSMSEEKKKKSKRTSGDGEDIEKKKKKKESERDPLDWEDDKFPKMAERGVVPALIDQEKLREMQQQAKKQYISSLGPDPAKVQRTWKYHFGISALENVTQSEWEVSETGNKFDQFKNRLHGTFQYTRGYKVKPNIRKKFKRLEQVYSKEHTFSYKQMQNHFVTMDLWSAKRSFYDLANDNVYQTVGIKAAGQPQQNKGAADEDKRGFQIGNIFVQCLCSEVMRFDIALNNWQFLPKPELADNSSKKKLRLGIPTGPKKSNDTFETEPCEPPVYSWARGGMFVYKGTKESLNNEVLTIEVLKEQQGSFQSQGKALVGLRGAIDYPIAVGVVKTLTTKAKEYVQGRAGGSISMAFRSIALKPGQNDEDTIEGGRQGCHGHLAMKACQI
eukprot:g4.t2